MSCLKMGSLFLFAFLLGTLLNCSKADYSSTTGDELPIHKIPGTDLYTGIFYTISMKKYPNGFVATTTTDLPKSEAITGKFIQIDINPNNLPHYAMGQLDPDETITGVPKQIVSEGKWFSDVQWMLIEASKKGSYVMINKKNLDTMTFQYYTDTGYTHLVLQNCSNCSGDVSDSFIKPIMTDDKSEFKYQLKFDNFPDGTVTWTTTKYGDYSHYLQISYKSGDKPKYQKGGEFYDDTLFSFTPILAKSDIVGYISKIDFDESPSKILFKYSKIVKEIVEKIKVLDASEIVTLDSEALGDADILRLNINEKLPNKLGLMGRFSIPNLKIADSIYAPMYEINHEPYHKKEDIQALPLEKVLTKEVVVPEGKKVDVFVKSYILKDVEFSFRAFLTIYVRFNTIKAKDNNEEVVTTKAPAKIVKDMLITFGMKEEDLYIVGDKVLTPITGVINSEFVISSDIYAEVQ